MLIIMCVLKGLMDDASGHFESFISWFDAPPKYFAWVVIKAIVFVWLPLCPDDTPIIGGILQVTRKRLWTQSISYDYIDSKWGQGVPFDVGSKSFDMSNTLFRYSWGSSRKGRIANISQVSDAVYNRLIQVLRPA